MAGGPVIPLLSTDLVPLLQLEVILQPEVILQLEVILQTVSIPTLSMEANHEDQE